MFGIPSPSDPWGWQIDGHHLNINCFVLGDQLVMTPTFMGSEPVLARFGKYEGTRVFAAEEEQGYALMRALSIDERQRASAMMICRPRAGSVSKRCSARIPDAYVGATARSPTKMRSAT
jgi:hypothetical protein